MNTLGTLTYLGLGNDMATTIKKPRDYYSRTFLNRDKGSAHTIAQGSFDNWSFDGSFLVADCNRHATIEFFSFNIKEYKSNYVKILKMLNELEALRDYMEKNEAYAEQVFTAKNKKINSKPFNLAEVLNDK